MSLFRLGIEAEVGVGAWEGVVFALEGAGESCHMVFFWLVQGIVKLDASKIQKEKGKRKKRGRREVGKGVSIKRTLIKLAELLEKTRSLSWTAVFLRVAGPPVPLPPVIDPRLLPRPIPDTPEEPLM